MGIEVSAYAYIVFGRQGCSEDEILPVGLGISFKFVNPVSGFGSLRKGLSIEVHQFCGRHDRNLL